MNSVLLSTVDARLVGLHWNTMRTLDGVVVGGVLLRWSWSDDGFSTTQQEVYGIAQDKCVSCVSSCSCHWPPCNFHAAGFPAYFLALILCIYCHSIVALTQCWQYLNGLIRFRAWLGLFFYRSCPYVRRWKIVQISWACSRVSVKMTVVGPIVVASRA